MQKYYQPITNSFIKINFVEHMSYIEMLYYIIIYTCEFLHTLFLVGYNNFNFHIFSHLSITRIILGHLTDTKVRILMGIFSVWYFLLTLLNFNKRFLPSNLTKYIFLFIRNCSIFFFDIFISIFEYHYVSIIGLLLFIPLSFVSSLCYSVKLKKSDWMSTINEKYHYNSQYLKFLIVITTRIVSKYYNIHSAFILFCLMFYNTERFFYYEPYWYDFANYVSMICYGSFTGLSLLGFLQSYLNTSYSTGFISGMMIFFGFISAFLFFIKQKYIKIRTYEINNGSKKTSFQYSFQTFFQNLKRFITKKEKIQTSPKITKFQQPRFIAKKNNNSIAEENSDESFGDDIINDNYETLKINEHYFFNADDVYPHIKFLINNNQQNSVINIVETASQQFDGNLELCALKMRIIFYITKNYDTTIFLYKQLEKQKISWNLSYVLCYVNNDYDKLNILNNKKTINYVEYNQEYNNLLICSQSHT